MEEIDSIQRIYSHSPIPMAVFKKVGESLASARPVYHNSAWLNIFSLENLDMSVSELLIYLTGESAKTQEIIYQLDQHQSITRQFFNLREFKEYLLSIWPIDDKTFVASILQLSSERHDTETGILSSRWNSLLSLLYDYFFVFDEECKFIDVYTGNKKDLYLPPEIFLGKRVEEVLPPDIAELTKRNVKKVIQNQEIASDEYTLNLNGEERYFETRYIYVAKREVMAIVRDITPLKLAEAKAQRAFNIQDKIFRMALEYVHVDPGNLEVGLLRMLQDIATDLNADWAFIHFSPFVKELSEKLLKYNFGGNNDVLQSFAIQISKNFHKKHLKSPVEEKILELYKDVNTEEPIQLFLTRQQVHTLILVSIPGDEGNLGLVGFARTNTLAQWQDYEKDMLRLFSRLLKNIINHNALFSQLKESEQKYKHLQELFRSIVDDMEDMLWAKDTDKRFIFVNRAICEKLLNARDIEEPLGKTDLYFEERERISHPENPKYHTFGEVCQDSDQVVLDTRRPGRFDEFGNVKGKFLFLDVIKTPLFDENGNMIAVVGSARDVTQEKRLESMHILQYAILEAATRLEGLKEFSSYAIRRIAEYFKIGNVFIALVDLDNQKFTELDSLDEKDSITSWPVKGSLSGYLLHQGNSLMLRKNEILELFQRGEIEWIGTPSAVWMGSVLQLENQKLGVIVVQDYQDENKFAADDLKLLDAIAKILGMVIFRKQQQLKLQEAYDKLKESDLFKERLLQNMSHELRTPLNGIMGFSSLMMEGHVEPHLMKKYAEDIYQSGVRLLHLISDLLDLTTYETQDIELEISHLSVHELLSALMDEFTKPANSKRIELKANFKLQPDIIIDTDYEKLRRILWNLISNAIKFTHKGYVSIDFKVQDGKLSFIVEDTGVGISPEQKEKIFDKFYQVDMRINRGFEGAGLGLALVKTLCKKLGGEIVVDSQPGEGSIFELLLPIRSIETPKTTDNQGIVEITTPKAVNRVLIVEDDQMNQDYLKFFFESKGFQVVCKNNGVDALNLFTDHSDFDWVIMDVKLPDIDGYTLTRKFKEINAMARIAIVTAYALEKDRTEAMEAGADLYFAKPLRLTDLNELIRKLTH
ncbi:MAG: ATP-binding protein [Bacteroidales bacterium]